MKGSLNIPLFDLEYYTDFLRGKDVRVYCDTGSRATRAVEHLNARGVKAAFISQEDVAKIEKEGKPILCAMNYLSVKPGLACMHA